MKKLEIKQDVADEKTVSGRTSSEYLMTIPAVLEYPLEEFDVQTFAHVCPCCGFRFND